jgi:outer membrane protein assembly factor BamB
MSGRFSPTACSVEVWKLDVQDRYGKLKIAFGMTSTPVLDAGRLYLQLIHGEGNPKTREAMLVCLDAATGKEIWKHDRASDGKDECEHSYASPILYRDSKQTFLVSHGADYVTAHSLEDGSELQPDAAVRRFAGCCRRDDRRPLGQEWPRLCVEGRWQGGRNR